MSIWNRRRVWLIFFLALVLRLIYLYQITNNPFFWLPIVDSETYDKMALLLSGGNWLWFTVYWQAPLYPYFLAVIYTIFGHGYLLVRIIQIIIGAGSCVLVYFIAERVCNRTVATIAGIMASVYGTLIFFDAELLNPSIIVFLNLLLVLLLLHSQANPRHKNWLAAGVIMGLSAIGKTEILLFLPLVLFWIWYVFRAQKSLRARLNYGLSFLLGTVFIILPVTLRNYYVGGDLVLVSSNVGINFYIGNHPDYEEMINIRPGEAWQCLGKWPQREGYMKPAQQSKFFIKKAFEYIRLNPGKYWRLLARKFGLFWNGNEIMRNQAIYPFRNYSWVLRILLWKTPWLAFPFGLLVPLAVAGMVLSFKERKRMLLLLLFIVANLIAVLLFFACARYRMPAVPFLIIFSAYTIYWWQWSLRKRQFKTFWLSLFIFAVVFLLANSNLSPMAKDFNADAYYNLGWHYEKRGWLDKARQAYEKAVNLKPDYREARKRLVELEAKTRIFETTDERR